MERDYAKEYVREFLSGYRKDKAALIERRKLELVIKLCAGKTERELIFRQGMSVAKNKLKELNNPIP